MPTKEDRKKDKLPIFQKRFNELRNEMSQDEFAKFIGVSRATVGFYENGERVPDALTLIRIADKCDVGVDYLLGLSNLRDGNADDRALEKRYGFNDFTLFAFKNLSEGLTRDEEAEYFRQELYERKVGVPRERKNYIGFVNLLFLFNFEETIKDLFDAYNNFTNDKREENDYLNDDSITDAERRLNTYMFKEQAKHLTKMPKYNELDFEEGEFENDDFKTPPMRTAFFDSESSLEFTLNMIKKNLEQMIREMEEEDRKYGNKI